MSWARRFGRIGPLRRRTRGAGPGASEERAQAWGPDDGGHAPGPQPSVAETEKRRIVSRSGPHVAAPLAPADLEPHARQDFADSIIGQVNGL